MRAKIDNSDGGATIDASLKTQDEPIINAFSHAEYKVLTTSEVTKEVDLSNRQVRRRLKDLTSRDILETRKPGQSRLWWVKGNIKEPITAQYPLLQYGYRMSVQLFLIGLAVGIVATILVMTSTLIYAYDVAPPLVGKADFLRVGFLSSMLASGFIISGTAVAVGDRVLRQFNIDLTEHV